jgi:hypothetical protein
LDAQGALPILIDSLPLFAGTGARAQHPIDVPFKKMKTYTLVLAAFLASPLMAQENGVKESQPEGNPQPAESKRIFGIIPNYRTSPSLLHYTPLTVREKFTIARQDALDRGTVILGAAFGAESQLTNANRSFGQGGAGFGRYFATSYADYFIGDYMTEAVFPSLLHQDPRYFRREKGSGLSRLGYSMGQIFWTHTDGGKGQFNYSEIGGNSAAVAISNAYYEDSRTASDAIVKLSTQLGVDLAANVLKEFWPDLNRKFRRHDKH